MQFSLLINEAAVISEKNVLTITRQSVQRRPGRATPSVCTGRVGALLKTRQAS